MKFRRLAKVNDYEHFLVGCDNKSEEKAFLALAKKKKWREEE